MAATAMEAMEENEGFKEMELWEHLAELRARLIRSGAYVVLGLVVAWNVYPWLYDLLFAPLKPILDERGGKIIFASFTDAFMLRLQVSLIAGLIVAIPLITFELWGFVAPGLTRSERKACYFVFPASILFFFGGVLCAYSMMGFVVGYFVGFIPPGGELLQQPLKYLTFLVKMIVAFGVCFQFPIILMFLAWIGLVTSQLLREQWRVAVVLCFVVGALTTPADPISMLVMATPLAILYVASIFMVGFVERLRERNEKKPTEALSAG
jgi:sec-independent protein translocase protein TatC